jgi:geranylgeranyl diphosphate synthase type II
MDAIGRIDFTLEQALAGAATDCPPKLQEALRYSVFPGGARLRPKLCLAVAWACGEDEPRVVDGAAAAIELLHCASLVHDDLPCFDNADERRGKPSVHKVYGEQLAVLSGDALIVLAFEALAQGATRAPHRLGALSTIVSRATGAAGGICAGQAWECEPEVDVSRYHRAKTGALFSAATMAGAAACAVPYEPWRALGELVGEAYQVADDIRDVVCNAETLGKPVGQDEALARPSACRELGLEGAIAKLNDLVARAVDSIPACPRQQELRAVVRQEALRFLPADLRQAAA